MSNWEQFADMVAMLVVASFAWISTALGPDGPTGSLAPAGISTPGQNQLGSIMRWAQQEDEPPIEQVGEDTNADVETLDEAAPPEEEGDPAEDVELLDRRASRSRSSRRCARRRRASRSRTSTRAGRRVSGTIDRDS
jgi:hypothetical protein